MLLTALVLFQLAFDLVVLVGLVVVLRRRPAAAAPPAPAWHGELVALAQDLLTVTEPLLDSLESRGVPRTEPPPAAGPPREASRRERHREAFALLRAGVDAAEVARRGQLPRAELRLLQNLVAAEAARTTPAE